MVKKIIDDLKKYGEVKRAYIGIYIADINTQIKDQLQLESLEGVLISKVLENSAAEKSGLKDFDVILQINGMKVNSTSELHEIIIQFNPEIKLNVEFKEKNQTKENYYKITIINFT